MARRIKWTATSWNDLQDTADFISKDSPYYAASFVREVRDAARSLKQFAERGRVIPEFNIHSIREIFVRNYRLIYQVSNNQVSILAFIHGSRDLKSTWVKEKR